ncbi:MAG TPA: hypothetical protein VMU71_03540 [Terracidiphilus sp.]|jgi:hypothetical protein|nr:hypothetical protein [Terracidiphilus sp.]
MPKSVHITTPWPTSEEVAKRFRIPKRRQKELDAMAREYVKQLQAEEKARGTNLKENEKQKDASAAD